MNELTSLSQGALIEIVLQQRAENEQLRARVAALEEQIRRLRGGKGSGAPLAIKPSWPEKEREARKPRERAYVRRREARVDEVRVHARAECPECQQPLSGGWEHRRRQVVEVRFETRVIDHVLVRRRCEVCGKQWLPEVGAAEFGVQGQRRLGVSVQALVTLLRIGCRVPVRMVGRVLREGAGLSVSSGEMTALLAGTAAAGKSALEALRQQLRSASAVCADETGWRENGKNGYLWGFSTPTLRYYEYRDTRAGRVPVEVLGEDFAGVVSCDFYGGYNRMQHLQRCWAHLLRAADELVERNPDRPEVGVWADALRDLYQQATAFSSPRARVRRRARHQFEQQAAALARPFAPDADAPQRVLSQRILKHLPELFVFVEHPQVPATNNLAERSLRPTVIARKISGGTRSAEGSRVRMGLMSLLGTWTAQGLPILRSCQELLLPTPAP